MRAAWVLLASMVGCSAEDPIFQDPDAREGYRLVGAYDASALRGMELYVPEEERPRPYEYIWIPSAQMKKSCGPAKAPDGLGIFEAEAIANRKMPALALVVERMGDIPSLDTGRVRVALGRDVPEVFLEPAVMPRYLQLVLEGNVALRFKMQIKTQLQTYLCMEHKTGRAWQGGDIDQVRQALLLNPPDKLEEDEAEIYARGMERGEDVRLQDRKFFGGQSEPVAALLGPPAACLQRSDDLVLSLPRSGQGDTSLSLQPSDVWGAAIAPCEDRVGAGTWYLGPRSMTLALSETANAKEPPPDPRTWSQLRIKTRAVGDAPEQQLVQVEFTGRELSAGPDGSVHEGVLLKEQPMFTPVGEGQLGLVDLVGKVPFRYPTVAAEGEPDKYTVLLIPNWQLVEAIRRLAADAPNKPRATAGTGVQDGVGWVLDHPEMLFLMAPEDPRAYDPLEPEKPIEWLNIAGVMSGGWGNLRGWGYTAGMLVGRSPIALPGVAVPTWDQVAMAHRATQHSIVLGAMAMLALVVGAGLGRLRDLWMKVPEERVEFWPGPPVVEEEEGGDDMATLAKGEEGE